MALTFGRLVAFVALAFLVASCERWKKTGREKTRGRLHCVQYEVPFSENYDSNVRWKVYFDGRAIAPQHGDTVCVASPDESLEALVFDREGVRVENDQPVFFPVHSDPTYELWSCDRHCLVAAGLGASPATIEHIDSGKSESYPTLPTPPLALSPDQRTLVTDGPSFGAYRKTPRKLCVNDLDGKTAVEWTLPREGFEWLDPCPSTTLEQAELVACLDRRQAKLGWKRNAAGRDELIAPASPDAKSRPASWGCTDDAPAASGSASPPPR